MRAKYFYRIEDMQPQTESIKQKIKKKYYLLKALLTNHQGK